MVVLGIEPRTFGASENYVFNITTMLSPQHAYDSF